MDPGRRNGNVTTVPSRTEVLSDIVAILADSLGVPPSTPIDEETRFFADLGLASIDAVVLSEAIQGHYGKGLPFHELMAEIGRRAERDLTIGELVTFLTKNL
jgi:acyl carrier protein